MKKITFLGLLMILISLGFLKGINTRAEGAFYSLNWFTVDGGGGTFLQGDGYNLGSTIAQSDAGTLSGNNYVVQGGFWYNNPPEITDHALFLPVVLR